MTTEVVVGRPVDVGTSPAAPLLPLARREAWRMLTSPALMLMVGYFVLIGGVGAVQDWRELLDRAALAEFAAYIGLLLLGPVTFICAHLVATSARRAGASAQLDASSMAGRHRDLALCLGVLIGPATLALGLALAGAWLASGVVVTLNPEAPGVMDWSASDVIQLPALVLGAGILGVVVARWLRFPGSLLVGFIGMCTLTLWMMAPALPAVRPWLSWFAMISWFSDMDAALTPAASMAWHAAYLLAWSWVGVCAVALRHGDGRRAWFLGLGIGVVVLVGTGIAQIPAT